MPKRLTSPGKTNSGRKRGDEDFAGLRGFQQGDSPRHIAWKAYARDDEPRVKQYAGVAVSSVWLDVPPGATAVRSASPTEVMP